MADLHAAEGRRTAGSKDSNRAITANTVGNFAQPAEAAMRAELARRVHTHPEVRGKFEGTGRREGKGGRGAQGAGVEGGSRKRDSSVCLDLRFQL